MLDIKKIYNFFYYISLIYIMNTDYIEYDDKIREERFIQNVKSKKNHAYYNDSCKDNLLYAKEQNTIYDPINNKMLYGINSNMKVLGVSDGTCNQLSPWLSQPNYICGLGTAGGNRCVPDAYENNNYGNNANDKLEHFESTTNSYNVTSSVIIVILIMILIGVLYSKYNKNIIL